MKPLPLAIIPTYVRSALDIEVFTTTLRTLRETASDRCNVLAVDDGSPAEDLVEALAIACKEYDADFHPREKNEGFCSPPDEPVLTTRDGYVPIGDLTPSYGLVSFRNDSSEVVVGNAQQGWPSRAARRSYAGRLVVVETRTGSTRVTPNHGIPYRWTDEARRKWCVYVMRRGSDWRLGKAQLVAYKGILGPRARTKHQGADAFWILSLHETQAGALKQELLLSWSYGVPTMLFRTAGGVLTQQHLDEVWAELNTEPAARALLTSFERDVDYPFGTLLSGRRKRLPLYAANLMPGDMRVYAPGRQRTRGYETALVEFSVDCESYRGEVVSLDVPPHEHYVSGGVVVHNSRTVNVGLRQCRSEQRDAILVNADIEFGLTPDWLELMEAQERIDGAGPASVVGALLLYPNGLIQHAGVLFSMLARAFVHRFNYGPGDLPEAQIPTSCPVTGALQLIRHECLQTVGIYDPSFWLGWEDVDYCIRAMLQGHDCVYQPQARAIHHESFFRSQRDGKIADWTERSWLRFVAKYANVNFAALVPGMFDQVADA